MEGVIVAKKSLKLISWNVNGIRAVMKSGFLEFVKKAKPDILCLQETRGPAEGYELAVPGYHEYWNPAKKPGYSGTAILTREKPLKVTCGMGIAKHDQEGRVLTAEYPNFFLVDVYVPNSKRGLERLPYRTQEWDKDFLKYLKTLERKKGVIFCGDMNVAHREIDLANPKANEKNHGFTPEERAGIDQMFQEGFVDTFREFNKDGNHYTWWSHFGQCRRKNVGWRIDYFCISSNLRSRLKSAFILSEVMGSDHCPVGITFG